MMPSRRRLSATLVGLAALLAVGWGCGAGRQDERLAPIRGVILVTLGNLGAAHLGAYGAERPTSPFFDRLATRGVLFERAISQSPASLTANASLVTGLYPRQHDVHPPAKALSPRAETLAQRFSHFGYRTAGFTDGGFVSRHFGFHGGFDEFADPPATSDSAAEGTFGRGLDFLRRLEPGERFFLYLHTTSLAAPYQPPPPYDELFALPRAPPAFAPTAVNLRHVDRGRLTADPATAARFAALYDGGVRYLDGILESFFAELERLGLVAETAIAITADHGEEFLEHGGLGHFQVYPEVIHVPLLVLHPALEGGERVPELVQSIDLAPTLYDLAGLPPADRVAGTSLAPLLTGGRRSATWAYAEAGSGRGQRTLLHQQSGVTHQLVATEIPAEPDGTWVTRRAALEFEDANVALSVASFYRERTLRWSVDYGEAQQRVIGTARQPLDLALPPGRPRYRLDLLADSCDTPRELGLSKDPRCLSFKLRGAAVRLAELFRLDQDPFAIRDIASDDLERQRQLGRQLSALAWSIVLPADRRPATGEAAETLRALGYLH